MRDGVNGDGRVSGAVRKRWKGGVGKGRRRGEGELARRQSLFCAGSGGFSVVS